MLIPTFEQNKQALENGTAGAAPVPLGAGPSGSSGTISSDSGFTPGGTAVTPGTTTASPAQNAVSPNVQAGTSGTLADRLIRPINQGISSARKGLANLNSMFQQQAGPSRDFQSVQGQIDKGIAGGATAAQTDAARNLVNASYSGPQGLDAGGVSNLYGSLERVAPLAGALGSLGGLQTAIQQAVPGLTPGEARFESQIVGRDTAFQDQANRARQQLAQTRSTIPIAQQRAERFADQRFGEEAGIADQSRQYLEDQGQGTMTALNALVNQRQAEQAAARQSYDQFQAGGLEIGNLLGDPTLSLEGLDGTRLSAGDFTGSVRDRTVEAQQALEDLLSRHPQYAGGSVDIGLGPSGDIRRSRDRATPYDMDFFSTVDSEGQSTQDADFLAELLRLFGPGGLPQVGGAEAGEYANVLPLFPANAVTFHNNFLKPSKFSHYGSGFSANAPFHGLTFPTGEESFQIDPFTAIDFDEDYRPHIGFNQGVVPTIENQSTDSQRARFNAIQDILGLSDRLDSPLVDYSGPSLVGDIGSIQRKEDEALAARTGLVDRSRDYLGLADHHLHGVDYLERDYEHLMRTPPQPHHNISLRAGLPGLDLERYTIPGASGPAAY